MPPDALPKTPIFQYTGGMATPLTAPLSTSPTAAKSMLARLLATENISVVHQNIPTAFFDLKTRSLHLPLWSNASGSLYDMLVGHEVAHALFTPADGWRSAIDSVSAATGCTKTIAKQYLNIVEDARIERMIQTRFRGLKSDFISAYKTLMEREFFGDLSDLSDKVFADRFNVYFKCGVHAGTAVRFDAAEQAFVDRGAAITTWDEVVDLATDMIRHAQESQRQMDEQEDTTPVAGESAESGETAEVDADGSDDGQQQDGQDESNSGSGEGDESQGSDGEPQSAEGEGEDAPADSSSAGEENAQKPQPSNAQRNTQNIAPTTNTALEKALEEFAKSGAQEVTEIVRVTTNDLSQKTQTVEYTQFLADMRSSAMSRFMGQPIRIADYTTASCTMATAFNRRKAADNWRRTSVAKTGSLDTLRMNQYKWTDDIFRRTTRLADGKNHGIVILLDWSSSMSAIMQSTMGQLFILADFCRKCSVPFEVYAFSDQDYTSSPDYFSKQSHAERDAAWVEDQKRRDEHALSTRNVTMLNLLSSRMNGAEYEAAKSCLWNWRQMGSCDSRYSLNGTPTTAALIAAAPLVEGFIRRTRVQIAHTVVLTDGEPTDEIAFSWRKHEEISGSRNAYGSGVAVVMTDPQTGATYDITRVAKYGKDSYGYRKRNGYFQFGTDGIPETVRHAHSMIAVDIIRRRTGAKMHWVGMTYGRRGMDASNWGMTAAKGSNWKRDGFVRGDVWGWDSAIIVESERILRDANGTVSSTAQRVISKAEEKMEKAGNNRALATAFMESQIAHGSLRTVATHLGELLAV